MSSQRHRQIFMNYGAACTAIAEKQPAAGYLRQIPGPYTVPVGVTGGPLKGSSLAGPAPAAIPAPQLEHPVLAAGVILAGSQKPLEPPVSGRSFPIGPLPLLRVEPSSNPFGVWYIVAPANGEQLRDGDRVTVEATGNSQVNGTVTVTDLRRGEEETWFFVPGLQLANVIDNKGRLTITSGGS